MALIRIQLRRGTAAEWAQANPVLAIGEPGLETDTKLQKVGDGTTAWLDLPYSTVAPEAVQQALAAVGQAGAAADAADAAATLASDKAAAAGASAAAAAAVPTTTDGLVRQLLETPGSQTVEKLTATYASGITVRATADGVTGVSAIIQAALDQARDAGGGSVYLPPRTLPYAIDTTLYIASNVHLFAYGATLKALPGCGHLLRAEGDRRSVWAPKSPAAAASTTGGTLAAGAKAYRVTAVTASGETIPTQEVTATTTGSTGSVTITWAAPRSRTGQPAVTSYNVYGRTSGSTTLLLGNVAGTSFADTGQAGTAQAFPVINPTVTRTANAGVHGGTFDQALITSNGLAIEGHYYGNSLDFVKVDDLVIEDIRVHNAPKWAIAVVDFKNLNTQRIHFETASDGIHVIGPGNTWRARDLYGTVGDDMTGLSLLEWPVEARSEGSIDDVVIENVHPTSAFSGCRMLGGTGLEFGSVTLRNYVGTCIGLAPAIYVNDNQFFPGRIGTVIRKLVIDGVKLTTTSLTYPQVSISATRADNVEISNVVCTQSSRRGVHFGAGTTKRARVHNISTTDGVTNVGMVYADAGTVNRLEVDGSYTTDATTLVNHVVVAGTATINRLECSNIDTVSAADAIYQDGSTTITSASVSNSRMNSGTGNSMVYLASNTISSPRWQFSNIISGIMQSMLKTKTPVEVQVTNITATPSAGLVSTYDAAASITIKGGNVTLPSGNGVFRNASQVLRSTSLGYPVDVSQLTKTAGDMAFNTNAALACGAGPVICDGTNWKHLFTGATY